MVFFNRMRGGGVKYGSIYASLAIGLFFGILTLDPYIGLACAIGYNLGERMGWGEWIGNLTNAKNNFITHESEEGRTNGIYWLVSKFVNPRMDWIKFCRYALGVRGIYWSIPTLAPLFFTSINPLIVIGCIVWLGVSFPLACELAYRTYPKLQSNFLGFNTAWNTQEGFYGLMQDIVLISLVLTKL